MVSCRCFTTKYKSNITPNNTKTNRGLFNISQPLPFFATGSRNRLTVRPKALIIDTAARTISPNRSGTIRKPQPQYCSFILILERSL